MHTNCMLPSNNHNAPVKWVLTKLCFIISIGFGDSEGTPSEHGKYKLIRKYELIYFSCLIQKSLLKAIDCWLDCLGLVEDAKVGYQYLKTLSHGNAVYVWGHSLGSA